MTTSAPLLLKSKFALLACSLLFAATPVLAGADPWLEQTMLIASDGADDSEFGYSVALAGDTAVVGASNVNVDGNSAQGAAYVFANDGENWNEQTKLIASDGAAGERFGSSVALMGDTALVGAPFTDSGQGAAYVFVYDGENWNEQAKLVAADGAASDEFGFSVALFGDTALVGARRAKVDGFDNGAAYVFTRDGAGVWSEQVKLVPDDWPFGSCSNQTCPRFGFSVALWEDSALVGAVREEVDGTARAGAAYVFVLDVGEWSQQARLTRPTPGDSEFFGTSVALQGDTALVGALQVEVNGNVAQGAAHVFTRNGGIWAEEQELTALDGGSGHNFGTSVALLDNTALVGAAATSLSGPGAAYRYSRDAGAWSEQQKFTDSDAFLFGNSVALSGSTALVGAPFANSFQGAAYVFVGPEAGGPDLIFEPAGLDFGTVEVGTTSAPQTATLSNTGDDDATGLTFNTPGNGFDIDSSACGDSLLTGGDCEVSVTFTPAATGPAGATLTADSDQGASADLALTGEGEVTGPAQLSFSPDDLDFGDVEVGTASAPQTATLSNTGDSDATGLTFNTPGGGFDVDSSACGASLPAGGDCEVSVTFTPAATGPANDTLTVEGDDEVSASLSLTGNGTNGGTEPGLLSVQPGELDFGTVEVGSDAVLNVTVSNAAEPGAEALTLATLDLDGGGAGAGDPETILVSLEPDGNQFGSDVYKLVMSADGRYVAFEGTLPVNFLAIFRRDLLTGTTEAVSLDTEGNRVRVEPWDLAITPDGRYIAYVHPFGTTPPIPDGPPGIYIRDMDTGVTELLDLPTTDGELPDHTWPRRPAISADARIVVFGHAATNLLPGSCAESTGDPDCDDIYVYDRDAETLERLSTAFDGTPSNGGNTLPVITPDGRFVAWRAEASNLVPDDTNGPGSDGVDVFVHDRDTGVTERVSVAADGSEGNGPSGAIWWPAITPDGRYVSFGSLASNLVPDDTNGQWDVFVRDRIAGTTERVSVASDGSQANGGASGESSAITPDGRFVTFRSDAWNLVPDDFNGTGDHFVHDRLTGVTERISVRTDGSEGFVDEIQSRLAISADGRFAAFPTNKPLVQGDSNGKADIYVRDRGWVAGDVFAITGGDCAVGTVLEPGDNCTVEITFTPPQPGDFEDALNVATDDEQGASVLLQGTGAVGPVLGFNPSVLDFGDVEVGTTSAPENATLTNTGDIDATGLAFTQPGSGFDADTSDCGNTLPPGGSCQVVITFTPPATGLSFSSLDAESDEGVTAGLNLSGNGTQQPPMPDQIFHHRFEGGGAQ